MSRMRQVIYYLGPHRLTGAELAWVDQVLSPEQRALFDGMGVPDRAHAYRVARRLEAHQAPPYVLEAALLHDCAKPADYGLAWRTLGVLLGPWLRGIPAEPRRAGWSRYLQIYRWHDAYGEDLAASAGSSAEALRLLGTLAGKPLSDPWLAAFEACDDQG